MTIDCNECLRLISRQIDRATSDKETQAARAHALECENCRVRFNVITGADRLLGKALASLKLTDGFSGMVAQRLAEVHLAESVKGVPKALAGAAAGLGVLVVVLFALLLTHSAPDIPKIGEFGRLEGEFELALFGSKSFYAAGMGQKIPRSARVQTRMGRGLLKFAGGRDVAVGDQTLLDMVHYHDGTKLLLERGEIYVLTSERDIQIDTPDAKVYGRKASFLVSYESSGRTTVVVESGEVSLLGVAGVATVSAGEKAELLEGEKPKGPVKTNLENYLGWVRQLGL